MSQYLKIPSGNLDKKRNQERKEESEPSKKLKAPEPATGILHTITTTLGSTAKKRKAREIALIRYGPIANKVKRIDGSELRFPHNDP